MMNKKEPELYNEGFILLHRKMLKWEWYEDPNTFRLFIHCLFKANHQDKNWKGIVVPRGSFITGRFSLSKELGISTQSIRTSLTKLKSTSELTIKTTNKYSVVTVNNYNKYQTSTSKSTNDQPTTNQQLTTTKEYKKENNISKDIGVHRNVEIDLILELYKKTVGHLPTDKKPRQVAYNIYQITQTFIKNHAGYKSYDFDSLIRKAFQVYSDREYKGETLDVFKRKYKVMLEKTSDSLKGGVNHDK